LDKSGLADNTLVVLTSDNGVAPYVGVGSERLEQLEAKGFQPSSDSLQSYRELEALGQYSSYVFRGHKSDIWEGGHRVPFMVRWPGQVQAGVTNSQLVSLVDFMATCADIVQAKLPADAGEDSESLLPLLLGKTVASRNAAVVFHSIDGFFGIQQGNWKLELCSSSGGWGEPKPGSKEALASRPTCMPAIQKSWSG
jgi:arylsulfatase A